MRGSLGTTGLRPMARIGVRKDGKEGMGLEFKAIGRKAYVL